MKTTYATFSPYVFSGDAVGGNFTTLYISSSNRYNNRGTYYAGRQSSLSFKERHIYKIGNNGKTTIRREVNSASGGTTYGYSYSKDGPYYTSPIVPVATETSINSQGNGTYNTYLAHSVSKDGQKAVLYDYGEGDYDSSLRTTQRATWDYYERTKKTFTYERDATMQTDGSAKVVTAEGGSVGYKAGTKNTLTRDAQNYTGFYLKTGGYITQGNSNEKYGTYEANANKHLTYFGGWLDNGNTDEFVFANQVVLKNDNQVYFTGGNAENVNPAGGVIKYYARPYGDTQVTYEQYTTEYDKDGLITYLGAVVTGRAEKLVTSETKYNTYSGGHKYSSAEMLELYTHQQMLTWDSPARKAGYIHVGRRGEVSPLMDGLEQGLVYSDIPSTDHWIGAQRDTSSLDGNIAGYGRTYGTGYTFSAKKDSDKEINLRCLKEHTRFKWEDQLRERIHYYRSNGFVSGKDGNKKYFSMNLGGDILPAVVGKHNDYITSVHTEVGMGVSNYVFSFGNTSPAEGFVEKQYTTFEFSKGTYTTDKYTNVDPYRTTLTSTVYNFSTDLDETKRTFRVATESNLLGLPTIFYSAHISEGDAGSYIESCAYQGGEKTESNEVRQGVIATAGFNDDQLFNYRLRKAGEISVSSVTVQLAKGVDKRYQMGTASLDKVYYQSLGQVFENRENFYATVNEGKRHEPFAKTVIVAPLAEIFTYQMATTTAKDTDGFIECTMPDWFTTQFKATEQLNYSEPFTIRPVLPTTFKTVQRTTYYDSDYWRRVAEVGTAHMQSYESNHDMPYWELLGSHQDYRSQVLHQYHL